jgi:hypothetical protein
LVISQVIGFQGESAGKLARMGTGGYGAAALLFALGIGYHVPKTAIFS